MLSHWRGWGRWWSGVRGRGPGILAERPTETRQPVSLASRNRDSCQGGEGWSSLCSQPGRTLWSCPQHLLAREWQGLTWDSNFSPFICVCGSSEVPRPWGLVLGTARCHPDPRDTELPLQSAPGGTEELLGAECLRGMSPRLVPALRTHVRIPGSTDCIYGLSRLPGPGPLPADAWTVTHPVGSGDTPFFPPSLRRVCSSPRGPGS